MNIGGSFHSLGGNWVAPGWLQSRNGFNGTFVLDVPFLEGSAPGLDTLQSYGILASSPLIDGGISLPTEVISAYSDIHPGTQGPPDIGANEYGGTTTRIRQSASGLSQKQVWKKYDLLGRSGSF